MARVVSIEKLQAARNLRGMKAFFVKKNLIDARLEIENLNNRFINCYVLQKLEEMNVAEPKRISMGLKNILTALMFTKFIYGYEAGRDFYLTLDQGEYIKELKRNCNGDCRGIIFLTNLLLELEIDFEFLLSQAVIELNQYLQENIKPLINEKSNQKILDEFFYTVSYLYPRVIAGIVKKGVYYGIKSCYCK